MFGTMLTIAFTVMLTYVIWRLAGVAAVKRAVPRWVVLVFGVASWTVFVLGRRAGHSGSEPAAPVLELIGMDWLATVFLIFVPLLAADLVTGFGHLGRQRARALRGWALLAGVLLAAVAVVQGQRAPIITSYEVRLHDLSPDADGTVIVAMSDLHLGSLLGEDWLAARIDQVEAQHPDAIVLLGDVVEGHRAPLAGFARTLRRLAAPHGVWGVTGNHEFHGGRSANSRVLEASGVHVLHDESASLRPGLVLAGVDDLASRRRRGEDADAVVARTLADRPTGATVLLSHTPLATVEAARLGVGLMLSGHTHGGQVWPFGLLVRTAYPLLGGRYEIAGMTTIVCRGTGTWGPRMRLWQPGEILRITLRADSRPQ